MTDDNTVAPAGTSSFPHPPGQDPAIVTIITPVLNDWQSCSVLLQRIDALPPQPAGRFRILIVNDGSTLPMPPTLCAGLGRGCIGDVAVLELACNVGHQRAIALGLAWAAKAFAASHVVVMDSDGEDDPADIPRLLEALRKRPGAIVVAGRAQRSEGMRFRLGYAAYQLLFRMLVGEQIDFGNFSAFGPAVVQRLARMANTWNHLAATLLGSRVPLIRVPTRRAARYAGHSTMDMPTLIAHGLSALAVFSDRVFARLLLFASGLGAMVLVGGLVVLGIRLFTTLATPGWASTVTGALAILFVQAILICLVAAVQMLATRNQPGAQPASMLGLFVLGLHEIALPAAR